MVTEADLEAKRLRAEGLRSEIRSIQIDTASAHSIAANELTSAQLDAEIARLERERDAALEHHEGSVEAAKKMMEAAAAAVDPTGAAIQSGNDQPPVVSPNEGALFGENTAADVNAAKAAEKSADKAVAEKAATEKAPEPPALPAPPAPIAPAATKTGGNK